MLYRFRQGDPSADVLDTRFESLGPTPASWLGHPIHVDNPTEPNGQRKKAMNMLRKFTILSATTSLLLGLGITVAQGSRRVHSLTDQCFGYFSDSASFCDNSACGQSAMFAPYQGKVQHATWQCCYDANGNLTGSNSYVCTPTVISSPSYPYGCCSSVTLPGDIPACPPQSCPSTHGVGGQGG